MSSRRTTEWARNPQSSLLTLHEEVIILAYRWRTRLALDDAHFRLKRLMPKLSRSTLYRCLKRRGLSRIGSDQNLSAADGRSSEGTRHL